MTTNHPQLKLRCAVLAALITVLFAPLSASAQTFPSNALLITLTPATQAVVAGNTVTFTGSVTNTYTQTVFLNGASAHSNRVEFLGDGRHLAVHQ